MRLLLSALAILFLPALTFLGSLVASLYYWPAPALLQDIPYGGAVLAADGKLLRLGLSQDGFYRLPAALDNIAPHMVTSTLEYEDRFFFSHPGVNPVALLRSAASYCVGQGRTPGASTITMQVARLKFHLTTSTPMGKLRQLLLALVLERHYSKQEILEAYFQLAPYGGNIEGVEAAARIYFDKPAARLTPGEAVALAVTPQNPAARNPGNGSRSTQARLLLARKLTPDLAAVAPLKVRHPCDLPFYAPHLSLQLLARGSGVFQTGLELNLQKQLERMVTDYVAATNGVQNASALLLDSQTMKISALVGSADYYQEAIAGQVDGTRARRSPGSTLKPFIYAKALDEGLIHPMSILPDTPRSFSGYDPENFDRGFKGPISARDALLASRNLPAVTLAQKLRQPGLYGLLNKAQVDFPQSADYYGLALVLGGAEVTMRELAGLYATLANGGIWQPLRVTEDDPQKPVRLFSPEAAWLTLQMLRREPGQWPCKTGTSNSYRDAWTCGLVGKYVLVVWVGDFENQPGSRFVGAEVALPLFQHLANAVALSKAQRPSASEPPADLNIGRLTVCSATGDVYRGQCALSAETWFIPGVSPVRDSGILQPILLDRQTGLRACLPDPATTQEVWWEVWPPDIRQLFEVAGVSKPPLPDWLPGCEGQTTVFSGAPGILLPAGEEIVRLPGGSLHLQAQATSDSGRIHWYSGNRYLGSSLAGEVLSCPQPPGDALEILAVDDQGRSTRKRYAIVSVE